LDTSETYSYALKVGEEVYGPYASETSARKAAGRAGISADILRLKVSVTSKLVAYYKSEATE
jgi:hypothetical protein